LFNDFSRIDLDKLYWKGCGTNAREIFKEKLVDWEKDKQKILEWVK
jgi:hypothetical protein